MNILIVRTFGKTMDATSYNVQEIGLAKAWVRAGHQADVVIYGGLKDDRTVLMVVVTSAGVIKDTLVRVPEGLSQEMLNNLSQVMSNALEDKPVTGIRQAFADVLRNLSENRRLFAGIGRMKGNKVL